MSKSKLESDAEDDSDTEEIKDKLSGSTPKTSVSVPNLNNGKSPHNKRRGLSETPEIQRKSRKLFAARTRDIDKLEERVRKRSLTNPRSSVDETESSRKSSVSSGGRHKRWSKDGSGVSGGSTGSGKQFAVTLLVNESDKTKIMDMLHKAKTVISRKVEKVMGRKPQKSEISNADALKTVLQNWVEEEETKEIEDQDEQIELIKAQERQVAQMRHVGLTPPIVVSPVPEEPEDNVDNESDQEDHEEDTEETGGADNDIEVQEVFEGQTSLLLPPKVTTKLKMPPLSPVQPMSPTRSLTPCDSVPRPAFLRQGSELSDSYKLRRPSSHYDAGAQAASSRPASRQQDSSTNPNPGYVSPPVFDYSAFARAKAFQETVAESRWEEEITETDPDDGEMNDLFDLNKIQRPESMIIPIGGVWRPDDEPVEDFFLDQDSESKSCLQPLRIDLVF